jgi:phosphoserine phosphatase
LVKELTFAYDLKARSGNRPMPAISNGEEQLVAQFLVVFDVDSTLIEDEAIDLLAERAGTKELVSDITERAMRGELDFASSLIERVASLKGLPEAVLAETAGKLRPTKGAAELISEIQRRSGFAAAVSGGFTQLLEPLQAKLKLDAVLANSLKVEDGKLTGEVLGSIVDRTAKAEYLKKLAAELGVRSDLTIAVGDGANDIDLVRSAGLGIAFCAKPKLREVADISLETRDLSQLIGLLP